MNKAVLTRIVPNVGKITLSIENVNQPYIFSDKMVEKEEQCRIRMMHVLRELVDMAMMTTEDMLGIYNNHDFYYNVDITKVYRNAPMPAPPRTKVQCSPTETDR